jgi:hypothetical protein
MRTDVRHQRRDVKVRTRILVFGVFLVVATASAVPVFFFAAAAVAARVCRRGSSGEALPGAR